jgi:hypothetical protein
MDDALTKLITGYKVLAASCIDYDKRDVPVFFFNTVFYRQLWCVWDPANTQIL